MKGDGEIHGLSDNTVCGKVEGSIYFDYWEIGQLFEGEDFCKAEFDKQTYTTDPDGENRAIRNLLDPFDGWVLPSRSNFFAFTGSREGATVNGTEGVRWAPYSLGDGRRGNLYFPDGETINGKELAIVNDCYDENDVLVSTTMTQTELEAYLAQGCAILPELNHGGSNASDYYALGEYNLCSEDDFNMYQFWEAEGDLRPFRWNSPVFLVKIVN